MGDSVFGNSKRIDVDSFDAYTKRTTKLWLDKSNELSRQHDTIGCKLLKRPPVFFIVKPVYIRDSSVCFIYMRYMWERGSGHAFSCFYKKENSLWVRWITMNMGDF